MLALAAGGCFGFDALAHSAIAAASARPCSKVRPRDAGSTSMVPLRAAGAFGLESTPCASSSLTVYGLLAGLRKRDGVQPKPRELERAARLRLRVSLRLHDGSLGHEQARLVRGVGCDAAGGVPELDSVADGEVSIPALPPHMLHTSAHTVEKTHVVLHAPASRNARECTHSKGEPGWCNRL
jgi:hypothetical protein